MPPTAQDYLFLFSDRSSSSLRPPASPLSTLSAASSGCTTAPSDAGGDDCKLRPFACSEPGCGRRFSRKFTLGEHMKTHTGERPYRCPLSECGKRFSTSGNLARHKRLHKDIKPFDCPVATCQRTFPTEDKLRHHVKIHTGDKVHVCGVAGCHKTFSTAGNLTRHTKLHHPEVDPRLYLSPRIRPRRTRVAVSSPRPPPHVCIQAPAATPVPVSLGSPSGVDSMDQRLDQLLIASPAPTPHVLNAWPTNPCVPPPCSAAELPVPLAAPKLEAPLSPERSDDFDSDPLLDDVPTPDAGRYSLSLLDDVVKFELTEA
jgi:hypothetical protein